MQTKTGIILLHKDKFDLYSPYLPTILQFQFVPELIQDFDLVNRELLENLVRVFLLNNKVPASNMVIIIADDASFIKDFMAPPVAPVSQQAGSLSVPQPPVTSPQTLEDLQNQANEYLTHVPFENVASKTFPLANGVRAYATNQDIYEAFKFVFEKHGFIIEFVLPGFAFGQEVSTKPFLDGASVTYILQKLNTLGEYNLLHQTLTNTDMTFTEEIDDKETTPKTEKEKRLFILVAIGGIVLLFLMTGGILYYQFTTPPYKAPVVTVTPPVIISPNPTTVPPNVQTTTAVSDVSTLTVQIIASSASVQQAQALQTTLRAFGFKTITVQMQDTLTTAQPLLVVSSRVSPQTKIALTQEVRKVVNNVVVQDKTDATVDIILTLGR